MNSHVLGGFCGLEYLPDCSKILFWIVTIYFYNNLIEKMNKKFDTEKKVLTLFFGFEISDDLKIYLPEGGGGLGVFAFHDVPSRRFAPRFVSF